MKNSNNYKKTIANFSLLIAFIMLLFTFSTKALAQTVVINQTPCTNENVQMLPARYYNYKDLEGGNNSYVKSAYGAYLIKIEKIEQESRKNFQATGCGLHVYFRPAGSVRTVDGVLRGAYTFALGAKPYICSEPQNLVKENGAFKTTFAVYANTFFGANVYNPQSDFYVTDKSIRYNIAIDMARSTSLAFSKEKKSKISEYLSEKSVLAIYANESNNNQTDFVKLMNGEGYVEKWVNNDPNDRTNYRSIKRVYMISKPGVPILVPVSRKEFLESLLEYYEIEKTNFSNEAEEMKKNSVYKDRISIIEADKVAYNQIYEAKKTRISNLLKSKSSEWLNKQVATNDRIKENDNKKASNGLFDFNDFENGTPLYKYNSEFCKINKDPYKPVLFRVECIYEFGAKGYQWSENLMKNFEKNFDMNALRKMLE